MLDRLAVVKIPCCHLLHKRYLTQQESRSSYSDCTRHFILFVIRIREQEVTYGEKSQEFD